MRYIDADATLKSLPDDLPYKASVKRVLTQAPAADVAEVKHGRWIVIDEENKLFSYTTHVICNNCGYGFPKLSRMNYCPNCGSENNKKKDG